MKKYFILSLTLIIVLYYYGCFSSYNYFTAKIDIRKNNYKLIYIDRPHIVIIWEQKIANKYNLNIINESFSFFVNDKIKGIEIYNNQMKKHILKSLGKNKYEKYQHEMDSLNTEISKQIFF